MVTIHKCSVFYSGKCTIAQNRFERNVKQNKKPNLFSATKKSSLSLEHLWTIMQRHLFLCVWWMCKALNCIRLNYTVSARTRMTFTELRLLISFHKWKNNFKNFTVPSFLKFPINLNELYLIEWAAIVSKNEIIQNIASRILREKNHLIAIILINWKQSSKISPS